jgi:hypothetical protein
MSRKAAAPRIYICTCQSVITVNGRGLRAAGKVLTAGAHVDFDEVIGDGPDGPVTVEQALGVHAQTFFRPAMTPQAPVVAQDEE